MQVQLQMFVYSLTLCYLVVWTKLGVFVNEVPFDSLFIQLVVDKLQIFWTTNVLPLMLQQLTELELKKGKFTINNTVIAALFLVQQISIFYNNFIKLYISIL